MDLEYTSALSREIGQNVLNKIFVLGAVLFWVFMFYQIIYRVFQRRQFGILFLGTMIALYILKELSNNELELNWVDISGLSISFIINLIVTVYFFVNFNTIVRQTGIASDFEYLLAILYLGTITYLTYREFGLPIVAVLLFTIMYAIYGQYFPGFLRHGGLGTRRVLQITVVNITGVFGSLTQIVGAWIALFMLYSGLFNLYGGFDYILEVAVKTTIYVKSGVAQTAVIASMIIGSINGSATANTGITGSVTIPMMKDNGMKSETAGAIEAIASTGGQIMPPVMGLAAFLMAQILLRPYTDILVAALIPAVIFYLSFAMVVHMVAVRQIDQDEVDKTREEIKQGKKDRDAAFKGRWGDAIKYVIPFIVLVYSLGIAGFTVGLSAVLSSVAMMATGIGVPLAKRLSIENVRTVAQQTLDGAIEGVTILGPIAVIVASINAIVDVLLTTGMPTKFSLSILSLSGGTLLVAALLAMFVCIVLGLGMPTSASYLIVALLIAPALINNFEVPELAAHFFVFFAALLAVITPPIAPGAAIASGIAGSDFMETALEASRMGAALFILPFSFLYHPEIVSTSVNGETLFSALLVLLGSFSVVYSLNYYMNYRNTLRLAVRALFLVLGLLAMVYPEAIVRVGAVAAMGVALILQHHTIPNLPRAEA